MFVGKTDTERQGRVAARIVGMGGGMGSHRRGDGDSGVAAAAAAAADADAHNGDDGGLLRRGEKLQGIVEGLQSRGGSEGTSTSAGVAMPSGKKSAIAALERLIDERVEICLAQRDRGVGALVEAVERLNTILCTSARTNHGKSSTSDPREQERENGERGGEGGGDGGGGVATTHRIDALVRVVERMATHMQVLDEAVRCKLLGLDHVDDEEGEIRIDERV